MFHQLSNERKRIIGSVIQLVYFMRGAIQYPDMMNMTLVEREAVSDFIHDRLEAEQKKMYPQY